MRALGCRLGPADQVLNFRFMGSPAWHLLPLPPPSSSPRTTAEECGGDSVLPHLVGPDPQEYIPGPGQPPGSWSALAPAADQFLFVAKF
jgi:hypothetical protein